MERGQAGSPPAAPRAEAAPVQGHAPRYDALMSVPQAVLDVIESQQQ